jgi:hypothetical protein
MEHPMVTPLGRRGQATMELAAALICSFVLLIGIVRFVLWGAERFQQRVINYDRSRQAVASSPLGWVDPAGAGWNIGLIEPATPADLID